LVNLNDPRQTLRFNKDQDIVFGYWNEAQNTFDTSAPLSSSNAARLNLARNPQKQIAIQPLFSQVLGMTSLSVSATTTALQRATYGDSSDNSGVIGGHFDVDTDHELETLLPKNCSGNFCDN
jgi:hypothetical protein